MQRLIPAVILAIVLCACTPSQKPASMPADDPQLKPWCQATFRARTVDALDLLSANPSYRAIMSKGTAPTKTRFAPAGMEQDAETVDRAMAGGDVAVLTAPETRAAAERLDAYATSSPQCASYTQGITPVTHPK